MALEAPNVESLSLHGAQDSISDKIIKQTKMSKFFYK